MRPLGRITKGASALALAMLATPMATAGANTAAAPMALRLEAVTNAIADASPSDEALAGKSDVDLVATAVRCVELDSRTYCLHLGWVDQAPTAERLREMVEAEAAVLDGEVDSRGDLPLATQIRTWAQQPRADRVAQERAELDEARRALGKVKLFDHWTTEAPVPEDFWRKYPETVSWGHPSNRQGKQGERGDVGVNCLDCNAVGERLRAQKQSTVYWCGPASMVAFAWNDPRRGNELSPHGYATQGFWAGRLGTTTAGTSIYALKDNINEHLTWKDLVFHYVVVSHLGWSVERWQSLFRSHFYPGFAAPVQLHPDLDPSNNRFGLSTGGHFNVARGYNFDVSEPVWFIYIWEPAGGGSGVPVEYVEYHANVIAANRNHSMDNIAY